MSTATLPMNGKPRKQLSDQLDRLDDLIDVLGDGLNDAVVTAMRDGARQAVKEALVEVLTHPEFLTALQSVIGPKEAVPAKPTVWQRIKAGLGQLRTVAANIFSSIKERATHTIHSVAAKLHSLRERGRAMVTVAHHSGLLIRHLTLTAVVVGVLTGMVAIVTPHELLAVAGAVGGAIATVVAQVAYRARRLMLTLMSVSAI
jgi:hypothetical protein